MSAPVRFAEHGDFTHDLRARVDAYLDGRGRDLPRMYLKSALILGWFMGSWALLVFVASEWWQGLALAVSLGLSIAAVGMSVQHDANHGATSKRAWVNRAFGASLDVMGVSSFIWRQKHNVIHHTYTNVEGVDFDLDFGVLARLSPEQRRRPWHRWQHLYLWALYGFLLPKWVFFDDFVLLATRIIGPHKMAKPPRATVLAFFVCKIAFVGWAIVIPALYHPLWAVLACHFVATFTLGLTLATVFQLAHCSGEADFPSAPDGRVAREWAEHQLATSVDFAPRNALVTWLVGGLNFQAEHHLFPKVCHLHYPALAKIVGAVARDHGIEHRVHGTLRGAIASHYRHLRRLGSR